ncbi:adenosylcobinamide-GDP ribazoletransferase [Nocardioides daphniae]|uniref:Adenosylcobinamide-GDP ribazoletransferase n=1 Tax=Nocardioides daphniae TaxID=402297 RepID=A0A4P7UEH7_9ACTN|nr:adenosylcobinamide-GDP ribazoletransferase [Nocardioides daphniae]
MRDGWRLALGTLTALPTAPPTVVNGASARAAVLLAPLAVLPLGAGVVALGWLGERLLLSGLTLGFLALGWLALTTRILHWDGLSDTADGLTASYDRERALQVMKSGTSGPAGVVATVVVAGLQVAGFAALLTSVRGAVAAGLAVCLSRLALSIACLRGVPPARRDGLGNPMSGVVAPWQAAMLWILWATGATAVAWWLDLPLAVMTPGMVLAAATVTALVAHCVRRLGGVTGDVFGAGIELALAAALLGTTAAL